MGRASGSKRGAWYAVGAYGLWGLFPIYWKLFPEVPALELLAHRMVWSFVALLLLVAGMHRPGLDTLRTISPRIAGIYAIAAALISVNWFLYVWAVNAGHVVETSLGYFITPLVNVLLGVIIFRERLRRLQWLAVGLAGAGVLYLTRAYGSLPWIAIGLASSFGGYGLAKKKGSLGSLEGLTFETAILLLPAAMYLFLLHARGDGVFMRTDAATHVLIVASGIITVIPLLLFASAVRRVPLSLVGILQYISPTIHLLLGVLLFHEPFRQAQFIGFSLVWMAVVVFAVDGIRAR